MVSERSRVQIQADSLGCVSCRWRYWSLGIACSIFSQFELSFIIRIEISFILDRCSHLKMCLELIEPNSQLLTVVKKFFGQRSVVLKCTFSKALTSSKKLVRFDKHIPSLT